MAAMRSMAASVLTMQSGRLVAAAMFSWVQYHRFTASETRVAAR
jgi:hypothetical protein